MDFVVGDVSKVVCIYCQKEISQWPLHHYYLKAGPSKIWVLTPNESIFFYLLHTSLASLHFGSAFSVSGKDLWKNWNCGGENGCLFHFYRKWSKRGVLSIKEKEGFNSLSAAINADRRKINKNVRGTTLRPLRQYDTGLIRTTLQASTLILMYFYDFNNRWRGRLLS